MSAFSAARRQHFFFIVVLYMQDVLGYAPLQSGLAWLPYTAAFLAGIMLSVQVAPRWGTRWIIIGGLAPVFIGLVHNGGGMHDPTNVTGGHYDHLHITVREN